MRRGEERREERGEDRREERTGERREERTGERRGEDRGAESGWDRGEERRGGRRAEEKTYWSGKTMKSYRYASLGQVNKTNEDSRAVGDQVLCDREA